MNKYLSLILLFVFSGSVANAQSRNKNTELELSFTGKTVTSLPWNTDGGLVVKETFEGSYGSTSFCHVANNQIAFLNELNNEISIYENEKLVSKFKSSISPTSGLNFIEGKFYLFGLDTYSIHDKNGEFIKNIPLPKELKSIRNIKEVDGKVFLVSEKQSSFLLKKNEFLKFKGVPLAEGLFAKAIKISNNLVELNLLNSKEETITFNYRTDKNLSSFKIIGGTKDKVFVDAEYIKQEKPLLAERRIIAFSIKNNKLKEIENLLLPNSYFVSVRRDIKVVDETIYYYLTTPQYGQVFEFNLDTNQNKFKFAKDVISKSFHYNNNEVETFDYSSYSKTSSRDSVVDPISREEIISRAEAFETHIWIATESNIWNKRCSVDYKSVISAPYVKVGENRSVPYMWDGFSSLEKFDEGMAHGLSAGNTYTKTNIGSMDCAEGVDCSGFVSQAWKTTWKYDTREFKPIIIMYDKWSDLKPGDIANKSGHVRLFHSWNDDGSMLMLEATSQKNVWRVVYNTYTIAEMQSKYDPYFLYSVYDETTAVSNFNLIDNSIKIYPNPVTDSFKILNELDDFDSKLTFDIINTKGEKLMRGIADDNYINIETLNAGIYFVRIKSDEFTIVKKIIKK